MIAHFFPWLKKPPGIASIIFAVFLVAAGQVLKTYGVLGPLANFTVYLERSLASFDAFHIGNVFYSELTGCELTEFSRDGLEVACKPGLSDSDVLLGERGPGWIQKVINSVSNTVTRLWSEGTWLGILIYTVSIAAGGYWLARKPVVNEFGFAGLLLLIVLTPAVASLMSLGLKWLLLLFVFLFSQVLAGVVWLVATFGAGAAWLFAGIEVLNKAHKVEAIGGGSPSNTTPKEPTDG